MRTARVTHRKVAATALLGLLLVGGCGSADGDDDAGGSAAERRDKVSQIDGPRFGGDDTAYDTRNGVSDGMALTDSLAEAAPEAPAEEREEAAEVGDKAIISKAVVSVESDDVEQARFDALKVMDNYAGSLQADETTSGDDGELETARLIMRIPSKDYAKAKAELEKVADFVESRSGSEDVTTEVIDVAARIRAQEASLERVEALLVQARNLRQVIAIESQLARRQADLDSLKSRQAYLEDQTGEATITMHIEKIKEEKQKKDEDDDKGFVSGLSDGWDNLVAATVGILTVLGLLLPFAVVIALLTVPTLALIRRLRPELARQPAAEPAAE